MKLRPSIAIGFATWLLLLLIMPAAAAPRQVMHGHVPEAIVRLHLQPTGQTCQHKSFESGDWAAIANPEALTNLLREIYDPASANFRHFLKLKQ
jgi:hypothetical protein